MSQANAALTLFPQTSALDRFRDCLANKPYCGPDKSAHMIRSQWHAVREAYIQANPPTHTCWITLDLDHCNAWIWKDRGLPAPNLIVRNKVTGRSHLSYAIKPVCITEQGRVHPVRYLDAVRRALALALDADDQYTGRITKNPLSPVWHTTELHPDEYDLGELADSLELTTKPYFQVVDEDPRGRNCSLFLNLRYWAYGEVLRFKASSTADAWDRAVLDRAIDLNAFPDPLPYNELKASAKSVARWTWKHYRGSGIQRGIMALNDSGYTLRERQQKAAGRTNTLRAADTEQRILRAIEALAATDEKPTQTAIAARARISRTQLAQRYRHLLPGSAAEPSEKAVKSGVYQITAVRGDNPGVGECVVSLDQSDSSIQPSVVPDFPRSGGLVSASVFSGLVGVFDDMARVVEGEGGVFPWEAADRLRLARVLLAQALPQVERELLAVEVASRCVEPAYWGRRVSDWVGYLVVVARERGGALDAEKAQKTRRFQAFCRGEPVVLADDELPELLAFQRRLLGKPEREDSS